jgi:WD40 repeat protein
MNEMNFTLGVKGHIKIWNPETKEVFVDKDNAIHFENFSEALAYSLSNKGHSFISEMHFGNGGTSIDPTGVIAYLPPNSEGVNADLYSPTYYKIVDDNNLLNPDSLRNKMEVRPIVGKNYSDILVSCLLDYGEPNDQAAFDNSQNLSGSYVFDELGLKGFKQNAAGQGKLLTHVIFHPVQKSLNRLIQIDYTIRISTLTNLNFIG